jgi:hypothetical protein
VVSDKPLLLLDVDGPLNPWAASNRQVPKGYRQWRIEGYKVRLAPWHGEELLKLAKVYDLVWATTWEHTANTEIGPRIGLPKLPVIEFEKHLPEKPPSPGLHWKTSVITAYAGAHDRPFIWVDDEVTVTDALWFTKWAPRPFRTQRIDPAVGLATEDFATLRKWAEELADD